MTEAVIGHSVRAADRLIDGGTGGAHAAPTPLSRLVRHALRPLGAAQRPAGVVRAALTRVEGNQLQVQPAGILHIPNQTLEQTLLLL